MPFDPAKIERLIARADSSLKTLEDDQIALINAALDRSFERLVKQLKAKWSEFDREAIPNLLGNQRGLLLIDQLGSLTQLLNPDQREAIEQQLQEMIAQASEVGIASAGDMVQLVAGDSFVLNTVDIPIEAIAAQARDASSRLFRYDAQFQAQASSLIIEGLSQGWGVGKTTKFLRERLGVTKSSAERIARTETISALDTANRQSYSSNGVRYVMRIATQDNRVCGYCAARAGNVYPVENAPAAIHPNDRCFNAPFFPGDKRAMEFAIRHQADARAQSDDKLREGAAPFETERPQPLWKPGDGEFSTKPTADTTALHERAVLSLDGRYNKQYLDAGLDAIAQNGGSDRVALVRQFINQKQIQTVFSPREVTIENLTDYALLGQQLINKDVGSWDITDTLMLSPNANGHTSAAWNHIVVRQKPTGDGDISVNYDLLKYTVEYAYKRANENDPVWTIGNIAPTGGTREFMTWVHELGHQVHAAIGDADPPGDIAGSISDYGATNNQEWFAEHFSAWLFDPDGYRKLDQVAVEFIEESVRRAVRETSR